MKFEIIQTEEHGGPGNVGGVFRRLNDHEVGEIRAVLLLGGDDLPHVSQTFDRISFVAGFCQSRQQERNKD